jgi:uncharacterized protein
VKRVFYAGIVLLGLVLSGNLLTYTLQFHVIFRPEKLDAALPFDFEDPYEEVWLHTPAKGRIHALWFHAPETCSPRGVVLYFHGNAGALDRWGDIFRQQFRDYGCDLFIMDYRRFGKSQGPVSEKAFYADALAAYDFLEARYRPEDMVIYGRSMGTGLASHVAAHRKAREVVLETPFASMPDLFYTYYPFLPRLFLFQFRLDNRHWLASVRDPITILAGNEDYVTPLRCANRLRPSLKAQDRFVVIEGAGHHDLADFPAFRKEMDRILGRPSVPLD